MNRVIEKRDQYHEKIKQSAVMLLSAKEYPAEQTKVVMICRDI